MYVSPSTKKWPQIGSVDLLSGGQGEHGTKSWIGFQHTYLKWRKYIYLFYLQMSFLSHLFSDGGIGEAFECRSTIILFLRLITGADTFSEQRLILTHLVLSLGTKHSGRSLLLSPPPPHIHKQLWEMPGRIHFSVCRLPEKQIHLVLFLFP